MSYTRKTPKRGARPEEVALLVSLLESPRVVESGPLGRCLKRGWCTWISAEARRPKSHVPVAITREGMLAASLVNAGAR